ncbi:FAD-binding oxidoreductase [Mycolicibacterium boenickei]
MSAFDGTVYRYGEQGYEAARRTAVWNQLKPERFPSVIVVAGSRNDVGRTVALARRENLTIGIRSGGHSWVGNGVREGGLLLDLSQLRAIEIDPQRLTAAIEPGVRGNEFAAALGRHGLYFPVGHCPTVGVTGFLLAGGIGFNSDTIGPAAFSMRAIDVVTADGEILHATDEDNADLLWAARGGGPGYFAAVTRAYLELRPLPGAIASTIQIYPLAHYDQILPWFLDVANSVEGAKLVLVVGSNPAFGQDDTVITLAGYIFADNLDQASERLAPLATAPTLNCAILHEPPSLTSIEQLHKMFDAMYPEGFRYLSDNVHIDDLAAPGLWETVRTTVETLPSKRSCVWVAPGLSEFRRSNAAFSLQSQFSLHVYAVYQDDDQDAAMLNWHTDALARVDPYSLGGGYVGESSLFTHPQAILDPDNAARLESLRHKYDPHGRFHSFPSELPVARVPRSLDNRDLTN